MCFGCLFLINPKSGDIPTSVTYLEFGDNFNQPLNPGIIPINVVRYILVIISVHPINPGDIPANVTHLSLGFLFNHFIHPGSIPIKVTHLFFSNCFNQH